MTSLPQLSRTLQRVLTDVPTALARSTGFCRRQRKLTGATFVQTLVFGWLAQPKATLQQLTHRAADRGVSISPQGLAQRFTPAAAALLRGVWEAALSEVVLADPQTAGLLGRFPAVVLLDSTTIPLPDGLGHVWAGCGGRVEQGSQAALKLTVGFDLVRGGLSMHPSAGRAQDRASPVQHAPVPNGGIRVADQGFWSLPVLQEIADGGAYFLSRLQLQTIVFTPDGERIDLVRWLDQPTRHRVSRAVELGVEARLPARLLAVRVPGRVAKDRREQLRAQAQREGETVNPTTWALAAWTLLVTNAPPDLLSIREALVLARARWQIELLFKLWKDGGHLDAWRSADPDRILCEVYAKLTALVIQHWLLLVGCWHEVERSLTQAAQVVREHAIGLGVVFSSRPGLLRALEAVTRCLARAGHIQRRRGRPSLFQLLTDPPSPP